MVLGGAIGLYVVYKFVGSSSSSSTSVQSTGPTAAQLQYQASADVLATQSASDQLHAGVAMAQINANAQTSQLATNVGGTVALAKIQGTSTDIQNSLIAQVTSNQISANTAVQQSSINASVAGKQIDANVAMYGMAQSVNMVSAQGTATAGIINTTGNAITNITLANNQIPLATINAASAANISSIQSARDITVAGINMLPAYTNAQANVIKAQSLQPIAYFNSMGQVQQSYNQNQPLLLNAVKGGGGSSTPQNTSGTGSGQVAGVLNSGVGDSGVTGITGGTYGTSGSLDGGYSGTGFGGAFGSGTDSGFSGFSGSFGV